MDGCKVAVANKERTQRRRKVGHRYLPLTKPGAGVYICKSEMTVQETNILHAKGP